jgi:putative molybdopterin biosynthesis protein
VWADAVVPIEATQPMRDESGSVEAIEIRASLAPWANVRAMGEDLVASELVLPAGHRLRPVDLGAIASAGHARVRVARRPRVAVIPSGDELIAPGAVEALRGEIIEFNSLVLAAQVDEWGGAARRFATCATTWRRCAARSNRSARGGPGADQRRLIGRQRRFLRVRWRKWVACWCTAWR